MKKFEYMCQRLRSDQPNLEQALDMLGKDGWELCTSISVATDLTIREPVAILIFKREIPEANKPPDTGMFDPQ